MVTVCRWKNLDEEHKESVISLQCSCLVPVPVGLWLWEYWWRKEKEEGLNGVGVSRH